METFADLIRQAAAVVGVQVERVWPAVVFWYWLKGVQNAVAALIALGIGLALAVPRWKILRDPDDAPREEQAAAWKTGALFVVGVLFLFGGVLAFFAEAIDVARLVNPEAALLAEKVLGK